MKEKARRKSDRKMHIQLPAVEYMAVRYLDDSRIKNDAA